jgi:hypothetical protein
MIGGLLRGREERPNPGAEAQRALSEMLMGELNDDPMEAPTIQAALAALRKQLQRRKDDDEADAVARGAEGTEYEIAQAEQRGSQETTARRGIVREAGANRQRTLAQAMQGASAVSANFWRRETARRSDRNAMAGALGEAAGAFALTSALGGGGGGNATASAPRGRTVRNPLAIA